MTFTEYLNTNNLELEEISNFYIEFLKNLSSKDFPFEEQIHLKGASDKFLQCIDKVTYLEKERKSIFVEKINAFSEELKKYRKFENPTVITNILHPFKRNYIIYIRDSFEEIFTLSLNLIKDANEMIEFRRDRIDLNGFYEPKNSNKQQIKELIEESIDLIKSDEILTEKSKNQLIKYLSKVLNNLDSKNTDWTNLIGKIKEVVIVLGALGSFAGGVSSLIKAKEKLEETNEIIEKTSVNFNFKTINETYNLKSKLQIENINNSILQLKENNTNNN
ncbi:hypothetical protein LX95_02760 [Mesonia algae]|uniref:Uncharacterized protein n=1 Tax=Mesonia algae TaxID=213248 RepID=A0A2W7HUR9_9FLAO|nr:hypothetical protein [Mesonia algae]PZW37967.1 hypothetical protein LX95_02760 [Mesonia algae]